MRIISEADIPDSQDYRVLAEELRKQFLGLRNGTSKNLYRKRLETSEGILDLMGGIDQEREMGAVKQYFYGGKIDFLVSLFSTRSSEILALFPGRKLTRIRTAAASALATEILSRKDSRVLGCIGAGYQASEQINAISQVRSIKRVIIYDTNIQKQTLLSREIEDKLGLETSTPETVGGDFREADILLTATTSDHPVINSEYVDERCYVNSIGSYTPSMREVDKSVICASKVVAVDSLEETSVATGEIVDVLSSGCLRREDINELAGLVAGDAKINRKGHRDGAYFKSIGVGIEDLAVAMFIYSQFLQ